jgi:hypothetical protein
MTAVTDAQWSYLLRPELLPFRGRYLADGGIVLDLIVRIMVKNSNIVASNNIRPIAFVSNCELRISFAPRECRGQAIFIFVCFLVLIIARLCNAGLVYSIDIQTGWAHLHRHLIQHPLLPLHPPRLQYPASPHPLSSSNL